MADCFERSWALAFCFVMFDQKDAMPMFVPAIVPHFFTALPIKIIQKIARAIQSKGEGARLRYKEIDPAKIVFHKNGFQYAANLRSGTGEKKCDSRLVQSVIEPMLEKTTADASQQKLPPFKPAPWDVKTGCETPLARLNEVFAAMLPTPAVLNKHVLLKSGRDSPNGSKDSPGVTSRFPTMDARNADTYAGRRANFIYQMKQARRDLLLRNADLLAETMGKTGRELTLAVKTCAEKHEKKYSMEFFTFFFQQIGERAARADSLEKTLHDAHAYATAKALKYAPLSDNEDMQNYGKFLSKFEVTRVEKSKRPPIPPRTGAVAYQAKALSARSIVVPR